MKDTLEEIMLYAVATLAVVVAGILVYIMKDDSGY